MLGSRRIAAGSLLAGVAMAGVAAAQPGARPGYITGTARTECGASLSRFTVSAYGFDGKVNVNPDGLPYLGSAQGSAGRYALRTRDSIRQRKPVNAYVRSVEASTSLTFAGRRYVLSLFPTDGKPNGTGHGDFAGYSARGIVRNFVLRTSGLKPGEQAYRGRETEGDGSATGAFYGGNLILALSFYPKAGQTLTVNLAPTTRLVDGCASHPITRTVDLARLNSSYIYLHDLPQAGYILTVRLNGSALGLHRNGDSGSSTSLPVSFPPTPELPDGSSPQTIDAG